MRTEGNWSKEIRREEEIWEINGRKYNNTTER
jgi:hypothetical protein